MYLLYVLKYLSLRNILKNICNAMLIFLSKECCVNSNIGKVMNTYFFVFNLIIFISNVCSANK